MKQHRMAALAAAAALAITSTVIAVPVQAAPEELMNSTFEDGYGAWKGVRREQQFNFKEKIF